MRSHQLKKRPFRRTTRLALEQLEERTVLSAGIGIYNPLNDVFSIRNTPTAGAADAVFQLSAPGSLPVVGDWNGDGTDGIGTFRIDTTEWMLRNTASAGAADAGRFRFGARGGSPVTGDWNGDHIDGIGVFDPSSTRWSLRQTASAGPANAGSFKFGTRGTIAIAGEFAGPAAPANALATVVLPPVNLDLLGLDRKSVV